MAMARANLENVGSHMLSGKRVTIERINAIPRKKPFSAEDKKARNTAAMLYNMALAGFPREERADLPPLAAELPSVSKTGRTAHFLVAKHDEAPIGFGVSIHSKKQPVGLLMFNFVHPEWRQKGLGSLMIRKRAELAPHVKTWFMETERIEDEPTEDQTNRMRAFNKPYWTPLIDGKPTDHYLPGTEYPLWLHILSAEKPSMTAAQLRTSVYGLYRHVYALPETEARARAAKAVPKGKISWTKPGSFVE